MAVSSCVSSVYVDAWPGVSASVDVPDLALARLRGVDPGPADALVGAVAADQVVVPVLATQQVVPAAAVDDVVAAEAADDVVARGAGQRLTRVRARIVHWA